MINITGRTLECGTHVCYFLDGTYIRKKDDEEVSRPERSPCCRDKNCISRLCISLTMKQDDRFVFVSALISYIIILVDIMYNNLRTQK